MSWCVLPKKKIFLTGANLAETKMTVIGQFAWVPKRCASAMPISARLERGAQICAETSLQRAEGGTDQGADIPPFQGLDFQAIQARAEIRTRNLDPIHSAPIDAIVSGTDGDPNMTLYDKSSYNKYDKVNFTEEPPRNDTGQVEYQELMRKYLKNQPQ